MSVFSLEDVATAVNGPGVRCDDESSSDSSEDMHSNWSAPVNVGWAKTSAFCRASMRLFSFCGMVRISVKHEVADRIYEVRCVEGTLTPFFLAFLLDFIALLSSFSLRLFAIASSLWPLAFCLNVVKA